MGESMMWFSDPKNKHIFSHFSAIIIPTDFSAIVLQVFVLYPAFTFYEIF